MINIQLTKILAHITQRKISTTSFSRITSEQQHKSPDVGLSVTQSRSPVTVRSRLRAPRAAPYRPAHRSFSWGSSVLQCANGCSLCQFQKCSWLPVAITSTWSIGWNASDAITCVASVCQRSLPPCAAQRRDTSHAETRSRHMPIHGDVTHRDTATSHVETRPRHMPRHGHVTRRHTVT